MKILNDVISVIKNHYLDIIYHESGGILGGKDEIVSELIFDRGINQQRICVYEPDVEFINKQIARWGDAGIRFMGMFHTHFGGADSLSDDDRRYITTIMESMPESVNQLYFPVITLPERRISSYKCVRDEELVIIEDDIINVI